MDLNFWHERWKQNQIGFHRTSINPYLTRFWSKVTSDKGKVFVPLCGKSLDLIWLNEQGHNVTAVECNLLAIESFIEENNLKYSCSNKDAFTVYFNSILSIYHGDYFDLQQRDLEGVKYVFDRASLVALPESLRERYVDHMTKYIHSGVPILLVTLEYDQTVMSGPPFSVDEDEINALYDNDYSIKQLYRNNIIEQENHFKSKGLDAMFESVYLMKKL